jgi:phosphatidylserine/phosphatidylglycerophosphate/cardiolipin synthase-like enzyme
VPEIVDRLDRALGDALESTVHAHHCRRLRKIGHGRALDPPLDGDVWPRDAASPRRSGNSVDVLIDGAKALPAIDEAIRGARSHVHLAGWHVDPDFVLRRDGAGKPLRDLLAETAERVDVRVLAWAGAPLPVIKPTRGMVREGRSRLVEGTKVRCALDSRERPLHCHHEKLVIVDDEVAFVGGIDLTRLAGDRFDEPGHPARGRLGWHDVATRIRGPLVADVARHFAARWREVADEGAELPPPAEPGPAGDVEAQLVRTVPEKVYDFLPQGEFSIVEAYLRAVRSAKRLVYLENQFLWSPEVCAVLADKLSNPPADGFRVVVLLPERANNGQDNTRGQLGVLTEADSRGGGGRFLATTIRSRTGGRAERMYVHAKVGIVDDRWLTVGSANINAHSFFNDSEVNVVTCDEALARDTRLRLWAEHLECEPSELTGDATAVVDDRWRPTATEQLKRARRDEPLTHHMLELPGVSRRAARLRGPLDSLVVDG